MTMLRRGAVAALSAILVAGCGQKPAPAAEEDRAALAAPQPPVVDVTTSDYAFQMPDTIAGGWVTIRNHNQGKELHHVQLLRLEQGKTFADLGAVADPLLEDWVVAVGGPSAPPPGGFLDTTVDLAPGSYAVVCVVPSPDKKLHVMKGMAKPLTVVAPSLAAQPAQADISVKLLDYGFEFSTPITAGKHTFWVETAPGQPHELIIARLVPGKTPAEFLAWVGNMVGPPPVEVIVGGTTAIAGGHVNVFQAEFVPGDYAIICFIPDQKDGKPHAAHGMMQQIKIS